MGPPSVRRAPCPTWQSPDIEPRTPLGDRVLCHQTARALPLLRRAPYGRTSSDRGRFLGPTLAQGIVVKSGKSERAEETRRRRTKHSNGRSPTEKRTNIDGPPSLLQPLSRCAPTELPFSQRAARLSIMTSAPGAPGRHTGASSCTLSGI